MVSTTYERFCKGKSLIQALKLYLKIYNGTSYAVLSRHGILDDFIQTYMLEVIRKLAQYEEKSNERVLDFNEFAWRYSLGRIRIGNRDYSILAVRAYAYIKRQFNFNRKFISLDAYINNDNDDTLSNNIEFNHTEHRDPYIRQELLLLVDKLKKYFVVVGQPELIKLLDQFLIYQETHDDEMYVNLGLTPKQKDQLMQKFRYHFGFFSGQSKHKKKKEVVVV